MQNKHREPTNDDQRKRKKHTTISHICFTKIDFSYLIFIRVHYLNLDTNTKANTNTNANANTNTEAMGHNRVIKTSENTISMLCLLPSFAVETHVAVIVVVVVVSVALLFFSFFFLFSHHFAHMCGFFLCKKRGIHDEQSIEQTAMNRE